MLFSLLIGYALGSIPFGWLLMRFSGKGDLRQKGSGNTGATNVLRSGSKVLALLTLLGDFFKGFVAVLITASLFSLEASLFAAAGALLGHGFPVWLKFRGGKGVATAFGVLSAFSWPVTLLVGLVWLVTASLSRYASLASSVAWATLPLYASYFLENQPVYFLTIFIAVFILARHHENIKRLLSGTEFRIGDTKNKPPPNG